MGFTLVYDSDCGPCTTFSEAVGFLDPRHRVRRLSIADAEGNGLLRDMSPELRGRSFHFILADGTAKSGAEALPDLAAQLPAGGLVSKALSSSSLLFGLAVYTYAALSRLHGAGSCAAPKPGRA
jgi:predicted DCC family thiol-disulfide oxidoreductase YuxK